LLRRPDIDHLLRAAAVISNHTRFVVVGTGAVIITAKHIPAEMMMTAEIDLYADGITDPEPISDLIDATIGHGSMFHRTFHYYCDGVGPGTAIMPLDWRMRAIEYCVPDGGAVAICPSADDIAVAKLCAGREKDRDWLRVAFPADIANAKRVAAFLRTSLPQTAPDVGVLERRLADLVGARPD
jgi:hypothetical protein